MGQLQQRRVAANEASFREGNERTTAAVVEFVGEDVQAGGTQFEIMCECGRSDCSSMLAISEHEYRRVRASDERFIVTPGHDLPDVEDVVERQDAYWVVNKTGVGAEVARERAEDHA